MTVVTRVPRWEPMALATRKRPYWTCRRCGFRNLRAHVKCRGVECASRRPKKRVPKHAVVLRDNPYQVFEKLSQEVHGGEAGACGVCGKPGSATRRHDRDHDHRTGNARGLACFYCNRELLRHATLEQARAVVSYLERVEAYYSERSD